MKLQGKSGEYIQIFLSAAPIPFLLSLTWVAIFVDFLNVFQPVSDSFIQEYWNNHPYEWFWDYIGSVFLFYFLIPAIWVGILSMIFKKYRLLANSVAVLIPLGLLIWALSGMSGDAGLAVPALILDAIIGIILTLIILYGHAFFESRKGKIVLITWAVLVVGYVLIHVGIQIGYIWIFHNL